MTSITSGPEQAESSIRVMRQDDLPQADMLRQAAGWNQRPADWKRLLAFAPDGCFVATQGQQVVGTVTTTRYGRTLAWIGMMLVHPDHRRRGHGRALMTAALNRLREQGVQCVMLDATPLGLPLYQQLGFTAEWAFHRWQRCADGPATTAATPKPIAERAASPSHSWTTGPFPDSHYEMDARAFGADRSQWLNELALAGQYHHAGDGYAMFRAGAVADYLGPVVARSSATAEELCRDVVRSAARTVFWDVAEINPQALKLAATLDFAPVRRLIRMRLGTLPYKPHTDWQYAIGDPATG